MIRIDFSPKRATQNGPAIGASAVYRASWVKISIPRVVFQQFLLRMGSLYVLNWSIAAAVTRQLRGVTL